MIQAWLCRSLMGLLANPGSYSPLNFGTELQVLCYNENETTILLHDGEYMISGILSNTAKQELIKSKPDPSQDINRAFVLLNHFCFSKANIVNNSGSCNSILSILLVDEDNFLIYITKISVIKWGYDEIINEEPQNLMSNPELAKRIKGLAYGTLGILNPVVELHFLNS